MIAGMSGWGIEHIPLDCSSLIEVGVNFLPVFRYKRGDGNVIITTGWWYFISSQMVGYFESSWCAISWCTSISFPDVFNQAGQSLWCSLLCILGEVLDIDCDNWFMYPVFTIRKLYKLAAAVDEVTPYQRICRAGIIVLSFIMQIWKRWRRPKTEEGDLINGVP